MNPRKWAAAFVALVIFAAMVLSIAGTDAWAQEGAQGGEDFTTLVEGLFDTHVIALEVLGIVLTAAMIGAMVIARPLGVPEDSIHYRTRLDRHGIEVLCHVSDVTPDLHATSVDLGGEEE